MVCGVNPDHSNFGNYSPANIITSYTGLATSCQGDEAFDYQYSPISLKTSLLRVDNVMSLVSY